MRSIDCKFSNRTGLKSLYLLRFRMWHEGEPVDYVIFDPGDSMRPIVISLR